MKHEAYIKHYVLNKKEQMLFWASVELFTIADISTVSSLLGHAQVSTTLDIYTHAFGKNRIRAARVLHEGLGV